MVKRSAADPNERPRAAARKILRSSQSNMPQICDTDHSRTQYRSVSARR
jgi:hypothetical protein